MAQAPKKSFELIYSRQSSGFIEGRAYSNPRFYTQPRQGVTKVYIVGDWPKIEADYTALGVPVERLDAPPVSAGPERIEAVSAAVQRLVSDVPEGERGDIEIPADWRELKWFALRSLATKFASTPVLNKADAEAAIEAEIRRRHSEEEGPNGLTRREMNADLTAAGEEIDPAMTIDRLAEVHAEGAAGEEV